MPVHDAFGRPLRSLRVSVSDRSKIRYTYCMPQGDYTIACFIEGQNRQIECGTLKVVKGKPIKDFVIEVKPAEPEVAAAN